VKFYRPLSRAVAGSLEITEAAEKGSKFHKKLRELVPPQRRDRRLGAPGGEFSRSIYLFLRAVFEA